MAEDSRGWQIGRSILDCHKYMLENHVACDVMFLFPMTDGSTETVPAHSYMLRCRSPVFEAMLSGNFKEKHEDITITDIEPDVFKEVLRYMYYDDVSLCSHNVLHVLFAAKKYLLLDGLVSRCHSYLKANMCEDNVCTILNHCLRYDEKQLTEECVDFMTSHVDGVVKSSDFLQLCQGALYMLLSNDDFGLPNEFDLYKACVKWAKEQKGTESTDSTRDILGEAFYQIRFHTISPEDVLEIGEEDPEILTKDEIVYLLHRQIKKTDPKQISFDVGKFNLNVRYIHAHSNVLIGGRFQRVTAVDPWMCDGPDRISFHTSKKAYFKGITLYGGLRKGDKHTVKLKLLKKSSVLCSTKSVITSDGTSMPIEMFVTDPVFLEANTRYTIEADRSGPDTFYGESGESTVKTDRFTITYSKFDGDSNDTGVIIGQIPQIILS